jgi:hypothetical protein
VRNSKIFAEKFRSKVVNESQTFEKKRVKKFKQVKGAQTLTRFLQVDAVKR